MPSASTLLRRLAVALFLGLIASAGVATAQQPTVPQTAQASAPAQEDAAQMPVSPVSLADGYVLGVGDVVQVSVLGRAEFNARVQVQTDGTIQLPYIHSIPAKNRTVLQLRDDIRERLKQGGFYTDPAVNVAVVSYTSRYVTVLGQVGTPGLVPIDRAYHVSEILARVGGARSSSDDQVVLRRANGEEQTLRIEDVASGGANQDPIVNPGDKLYVAEAPSFYIYGQVSAPGAYKVDRGMTLRMALARGGGLTERGSDKKIKLFRDGKEIDHLNLSDPIKGGDTIVIGERFF